MDQTYNLLHRQQFQTLAWMTGFNV